MSLLLFLSNIGLSFQIDNGLVKKAHQEEDVCSIDVVLEVGHYIHIVDKSPIKVQQYGMADPLRTYRGCKVTDVYSNYPFLMIVSAHGTGPGCGKWRAEVGPERYVGGWMDNFPLNTGRNRVKICVQGENVDIGRLPANYVGYKVAKVVIQLLPQW
jgi:hypothetical protein